MEDRNNVARVVENGADDQIVFDLVIPFLNESRDRDAASLVSRRWYGIEAITRKHVTMALCYTATPEQLSRRFPNLESLKLKGKPRAAMFNLIPEDWGGYVTRWVEEVSRSLPHLKSLHFRRMIVSDADLELIASQRGRTLEVLKLDKCCGFSTNGLFHITHRCRNLKTLFLEESKITDIDGRWLHEIAEHHSGLEHLNFYLTELGNVDFKHLEVIARKCPLISLKISDCDLVYLVRFFQASVRLEEFSGGSFNYLPVPENAGENDLNEQVRKYDAVRFPPKLCCLGLTFFGNSEMPVVFPVAARLKKLDLLYAFLDTEGHCQLLRRCPNLEILEVRDVIGDRGLEILAEFCRRLRRLRIERGADEQEIEDEEGIVTQRGLISLSRGCTELEYMAVYMTDITNAALESIGEHLKNLSDFRLVLLDREDNITELPLDNGVRSLLIGCSRLRRFALYLRPGGLTDVGLQYIGQYSPNVRWMLLGYVGESDDGLIAFSRGCPSLQKLEIRGCVFSEQAIALATSQLRSLRYLWVQGYRATSVGGHDLLGMVRPFWNIELIPTRRVPITNHNGEEAEPMEHPAHILAYYSLAGERTDFPPTVIPLRPLAYYIQ